MIQQAGGLHAAALAVIHGDAFPGRDAWGEDFIARQLNRPGVFAMVDCAGGMIMVRAVADEAEILTLAVASAVRRQGLGRALVLAGATHARRNGATQMFLEVSTQNFAARSLYDSLGFIQRGTRRAYYEDGTDAFVLARGIDTLG